MSDQSDRSADDRVTAWVRGAVRSMETYPVAEAQGMIKLDAMENPYQWPDEMVKTWTERLYPLELNRYPDPYAGKLLHRIRKAGLVPDDASVIFGNGSDELIQIVMLAVGGHGRTVLAPVPTFVMYEAIAAMTGTRFVGIPLRGDFTLDIDALLAGVREHDPAAVFVAYPNNPTANLFDRDAILALISETRGLVVIDEAYHIFSDATFVDQLARFDNLLILRTLSKMGLAGLRLGYLAGAVQWLEQFHKVRLPYNINVVTQATADFALRHYDVFQDQVTRILRERARVLKILDSLEQLTTYPSDTNFVIFRCDQCDADAIFAGLLQNEILIKNLNQPGTLLQGCLRSTVGKPHENETLLNMLSLLVNQ